MTEQDKQGAEREAFEKLCEALPEGVFWGDPLTPKIAQALRAEQREVVSAHLYSAVCAALKRIEGVLSRHGCQQGDDMAEWLDAALRTRPAPASQPVGEAGAGKMVSDLEVVIDEDGLPIWCAAVANACHDHINDAIDRGVAGAGKWVVRSYVLHPGYGRNAMAQAAPSVAQAGLSEVRAALIAARQFIRNGVEMGYITMPDADCPDPAHNTLPGIEAAIAILARSGQPAQEGM